MLASYRSFTGSCYPAALHPRAWIKWDGIVEHIHLRDSGIS